MATKVTFICDCCQREALNNFGRARIEVSGDKKLLVDDETQDLCEICWSPLTTSMQEISSKARTEKADERRNLPRVSQVTPLEALGRRWTPE
jgi:hypothetical protein